MTALLCPARLTVDRPDALVALCSAMLVSEDDVLLDARALRFADPFGMAILGATFYQLQKSGRSARVSGLVEAVSGYLQRMDVFPGVELVDCAPVRGIRRDRRDALVELTRINQRGDVNTAAFRLANALVGSIPGIDLDESRDEMTCVNTADRLIEPLNYALAELLDNAVIHGRRHNRQDARVWVASQFYPSRAMIQFAVVDNGCGLLETLRNHPPLRDAKRKTHLAAILGALQPWVSCNRETGLRHDSANEGIGLTTTSRIAAKAGGRLVVASGNAVHDPTLGSRELAAGTYWQGVALALECSRNQLLGVHVSDCLPQTIAQPAIHLRFE
ncbi:ATP-binding protein [Accumulibacter sp.]|uniref:ATP-binding protein n=1 Tax=Accumulibacter sp. TaxID=2053492 RepID=UPI00260BFB5C|nr:ATP-binding protein [Accumulibacter sp.]